MWLLTTSAFSVTQKNKAYVFAIRSTKGGSDSWPEKRALPQLIRAAKVA